MKLPIAMLLGACLFIGMGCEERPAPGEEMKTASGVLVHHPTDVRSVEAWRGHQFVVGEVAVQPSARVPEAELLRHVGKRVAVSGRWNPGVTPDPASKGAPSQMPLSPKPGQPIVRGDGIVLETLRELD